MAAWIPITIALVIIGSVMLAATLYYCFPWAELGLAQKPMAIAQVVAPSQPPVSASASATTTATRYMRIPRHNVAAVRVNARDLKFSI